MPGSMFCIEDRPNKFISDKGKYLCLTHESLVHIYKEDKRVVVVGVAYHITILVDGSLMYIGVDEIQAGSSGTGDATVESCRYQEARGDARSRTTCMDLLCNFSECVMGQ